MNQEIQELLQKLQDFTNTAVKKFQQGDKKSSTFYFNLAASISGQLAEKVQK